MAQRKQKTSRSTTTLPPQLAAGNLHAAGIDIGAEGHFVAVPPSDDPQPVRGFGACTAALDALADWLATGGIPPIALESPGVYWLPLFERLESRGFAVLLVDPQPVRQLPGRPKSDRHDCQWLQRRPPFGRLAAAFRPADQGCVVRSYLRPRAMLFTAAAQHRQHRQKALTQMHVKRPHVVSDSTGGTGLAISRAILAGERDPATLAPLRDDRCKSDEATLARALQGHWREEHLFALAPALDLYEFSHRQIRKCADKISTPLQTCADRSAGPPFPPSPRPRKRGRNQPAFAARAPLYRRTGGALTQSEGIDETTALIVLSEIGCDMSRWPTVKHFTSGLGLCPHPRGSGGQVRSRRTKPCANRAATALWLAAACLPHSQRAVGAFFRRRKARLGAPKAITATAHKLARLIYSMLKHGPTYVRQGMDEYEQQYRQRAVKNLRRRAHEVGYELHPTPEGPPA